MRRKLMTAVAAVGAAAAVSALSATAAGAEAQEVTDRFVSVGHDQAFGSHADRVLLVSPWNGDGEIFCEDHGPRLDRCYEVDPWGAPHAMWRIDNPFRPLFVTADIPNVDPPAMPQLPPAPPPPPPVEIVMPALPDSLGSSPGIDLDLTTSLGGLNLGVGTGS